MSHKQEGRSADRPSCYSALRTRLSGLTEDNPRRVLVIDFCQYIVGQVEAVDRPAALGRDGAQAVAEIFVVGFEKAVVDLVAFDLGRGIHPEEDAVGVAQEEAARRVGLATDF